MAPSTRAPMLVGARVPRARPAPKPSPCPRASARSVLTGRRARVPRARPAPKPSPCPRASARSVLTGRRARTGRAAEDVGPYHRSALGAGRSNGPRRAGPDVGRGARPARPPGLKTISVSPCLRALRVDRPEGAHGAGRRGRRPLPPFRPGAGRSNGPRHGPVPRRPRRGRRSRRSATLPKNLKLTIDRGGVRIVYYGT